MSLLRLFVIPDLTRNKGKFISLIQTIFNSRTVYLYNSARSALYAHLKSLNYSDGSEVIVTGFTCDVIVNSVIQAGLTPVYVDINEDNFCMSPDSVRTNISSKTRVIIIQHSFGIPADIDELIEIANKHNLYIIEDCAVSLGSKYKGKYTGTFGDAAIFSFELSKTITSCRSGMLFINNNKQNGIEKHKKLYTEVPDYITQHSWYMYSVRVDPFIRDAVVKHLENEGIETRLIFPPVHTQPFIQKTLGYTADLLPHTNQAWNSKIDIPAWPGIIETDLDKVVNAMQSALDKENQ